MSRKGDKNNQQASQPGQGNGLPPTPDQVRERRKVPSGQVYRRPSRWRKALKWETLRWVLVLLAIAGLAFGYGRFFSGAARSGKAAAKIEAQRGIIDVHEHIVPAAYRQALTDSGLSARDRFPIPAWDAQRNLKLAYPENVAGLAFRFTTPPLGLDSALVVGDTGDRARTGGEEKARENGPYRVWPHRMSARCDSAGAQIRRWTNPPRHCRTAAANG